MIEGDMRSENSEILGIIETVESYLKKDMSNSLNRCQLSDSLDYAPQGGFGDKELSKWLDKMSSELFLEPLDDDHPRKEEELVEYKGKMRDIIKHLEEKLPKSNTKTNHAGVVSNLINVLEHSLGEDLGLSSNRDRYVSAMYEAYKEISFEEQELVEWILSKSEELGANPLENDNPAREGEIEQYRGKLRRIAQYLLSTLPDGIQAEESEHKFYPK